MRAVTALLVVALLGAVHAASAPVASAGPPRAGADLGRARFFDQQGARAYGEGRYGDAVLFFEEAYRSGGPPFELWNVAKCHLRLDRPDLAVPVLERYLAMPNLPPEDRDEATRELESLRRKPSALAVASPAGAEVTVDGKSVGNAPMTVNVPPGAHDVTVGGDARRVEARYGRAIAFGAARDADAPVERGPFAVRLAFGVTLPRYGSVGGSVAPTLLAGATYTLVTGTTSVAVGVLGTLATDTWSDSIGATDAAGCAPLTRYRGGTALSGYAIVEGAWALAPRLRLAAQGGLGAASLVADELGGDVFSPTCRPSPGLRGAAVLGTRVDFAVTPAFEVGVVPALLQVHPSFGGTRVTPFDTASFWLRLSFGLSASLSF